MIVAARRTDAETLVEPRARWPVALSASIAGPVLVSLAFPKFNWGLCAAVALVPLFLLWCRSSWKHAFGWGWLAGTLFFALLFHWMTHSLGSFIGEWSWLALALLCAIEGLAIALVAVLTSLVCRGEFRTIAIFAVPAAWLLLESWRTRGSLGVPFGELGLAAVHLGWLAPAYAYGGVYLMSALFALVNAAICAVIAGPVPARRTGAVVLAVLAVLIVLGDVDQSHVTIPPPQVRVAIAQGNVSQDVKWTPAVFASTLRTYASLTHQAAISGAKVVIWPETAVTAYPLQDPALLVTLESIARGAGVWILTGTIDRPSPAAYYNAMLDVTPLGLTAGIYHKRWLVPFAEYLPLQNALRFVPIMAQVSRFEPGGGPHLLPAAGYRWGTLICYESAFAPYARQTANAGADAIVIATDDAWFGGTTGPFQHADIAVVDAISTGRWIVRGADTGISMFVDPKGRVISSLPLGVRGVLTADVGRGVITPYDRYGIAWLLAPALLVLIAGLLPKRPAPTGWRSRRGRP